MSTSAATVSAALKAIYPHVGDLLHFAGIIHEDVPLTPQIRDELLDILDVVEVHCELIRQALDSTYPPL